LETRRVSDAAQSRTGEGSNGRERPSLAS
jgi:hypothetical protein